MPPVGFEPTISAGERPQTYALDRAATGTGNFKKQWNNKFYYMAASCWFLLWVLYENYDAHIHEYQVIKYIHVLCWTP